ncbi:MAG: hypothetical protein GVY26_01740 [Bacteroidetes bacterium]|jgi:NhaP-type Na+/H+ or K+/H+ antiporter|nr:hypothetical protein [Bacteroidota bacterium]
MKKYKNGKEIVGVALIIICFLLLAANILNVVFNNGKVDFGFWIRIVAPSLTMLAMVILVLSWRRQRRG